MRWILCILWFLLAGRALQVDSPSSGSSFRTSGRSPTSGWSPLRTPGWFLLQDSLPFAIHLSSVGADLDENGPPVMNQIARGGYSLTPPEGGTTGVPLASSVRGQTPPSSSTLPGRFEPPTPRPCVGTEMGRLEPGTICCRYGKRATRPNQSSQINTRKLRARQVFTG